MVLFQVLFWLTIDIAVQEITRYYFTVNIALFFLRFFPLFLGFESEI
jgi:hypothetical protein